jgi:N-acetylneuraminic acid mutarotase
MQKLHYLKILIILLFVSFGHSVSQGWHHGQKMPGARKGMNAVVLGDEIWILGGSRKMHEVLSTVDVYDPVLDHWKDGGPDFQHARENATAQVFNGRIYLFGGRKGHQVVSHVEMFDPNAGHWLTVSEMPQPRFGLTSVLIDSSIWTIGGTLKNNSSSPRVDIYYPNSNRWERLEADLTIGRSSAMSAFVNGQVFVFGGFYFGPVSSYEKYDAEQGLWQTAGNMPTPAAGSGYAFENNSVWILGGMSNNGMTDNVIQFNSDLTWDYGAPLSKAKSEAAAVNYDDKLYIFGGQSNHNIGGMIDDGVEIYDIATAVEQREVKFPKKFEILTAYPNPFASQTTIQVSLPFNDNVNIWIFDILGRKVGQLYSGLLMPGKHSFNYWAIDDSGTRLSAGTYFVRYQGRSVQQTRKIIIF